MFFKILGEKNERNQKVKQILDTKIAAVLITIILQYTANDNAESAIQSTRIKPRRLYKFSLDPMIWKWITMDTRCLQIVAQENENEEKQLLLAKP